MTLSRHRFPYRGFGMSSPAVAWPLRAGGVSAYAVGGVEPKTVADFVNEVYKVSGSDTDFATMFTFSRASDATYVDSAGVMQVVGSNVARPGHHRYEGSSWVNKGFLLETEARTNSLTQSEDFTHADWSDVGTPAVTADQSTAPDGNTTADQIESDGAADEGRSQPVTVANDSTSHTATVFLRAGTQTSARIRLALTGGTTTKSGDADFDLSAGTAGTAGGDLDAIRIEPFGPDWYRCEALISNNGTGNTTLTVSVLVGDAAADTGTVFAWGAQLENALVSSSYIPTTTAAATRALDDLEIPAAKTGYAAGDTTMHMKGVVSYDLISGTDYTILGYYRTSTSRIDIVDNKWSVDARDDGGGAADNSNWSIPTGKFNAFNLAGGMADGSPISVAQNGAPVADGGAVNTMPVTGGSLRFGRDRSSRLFVGIFSLFRLWDSDLGSAGLEEATS